MMGMMAVSIAATLAGGIIAKRGADAAGKAAMQTAEYNKKIRERNAKVAENDADHRERVGEAEISDFEKRFREMQATAEVRYRKGGVVASSGTPLEVLMNSANEASKEKMTIGVRARTDSRALQERGVDQRFAGQLGLMEGRAKQAAYKSQGNAALLGSIGSAAMTGAKMYQLSPTPPKSKQVG